MAIQEQLIRFCKFLQENEAKKNRADRRAQEEERLRDQKQKEIDALRMSCADLQRQQDKLDRKVRALKKYEDYLENVKNSNQDQYNDPGEIIQRYKTLIKSNEHLVRDHSNLEQEFEKLKIECTTFEKEKNHEILQLNNEIKDLQKLLEVFLLCYFCFFVKTCLNHKKEKQKERNDLQASVEDSTKDASSKNLNLGRIILAIDNLYNKCQQIEILKIKAEHDQMLKIKICLKNTIFSLAIEMRRIKKAKETKKTKKKETKRMKSKIKKKKKMKMKISQKDV